MDPSVPSSNPAPQKVPEEIHFGSVTGRHEMTKHELGQQIIGLPDDQAREVIRGMIDALGDEIKGDTGLDQTNARIYLNLAILYFMKALRACRPPTEGEKK